MCLMLYIGTGSDLPPLTGADLSIEPVEEARLPVRQWFSQPFVRFSGAHTGCSCGFPNVMAESPIEYYDGMLKEAAQRSADLRSVRALIAVIARMVECDGRIELYPVWDGEEALPPKGLIELDLRSLEPEQFFFNERFMHVVEGPRGIV
jgi:hypothetical protein